MARRHWCWQACAGRLRDIAARHGADVRITEAEPFPRNAHCYVMTCPHGATFFMQPTTAQTRAWPDGHWSDGDWAGGGADG